MRSVTASRSCADRERGYALVSLLALMSLLALFALAVAPHMQQQTQREWEKEALFRGDQVSEAIRAYYSANTRYQGRQGVNALPSSMDQLLEGVQIPGRTKRLQILRPSAARDPLSSDGEWRLIGPTSQDFQGFVQSLTLYSGGVPPVPRQEFTGLASLVTRMSSVLDSQSAPAPGGQSSSLDPSGPFIGVASRSQRDSVITYFGIERHDEWIFTPMFR